MAGMRIAKIAYDHLMLEFGTGSPNSMSIGDLVDQELMQRINNGDLINEVTIVFDTDEHSNDAKNLRALYEGMTPLKSKAKR